MQVRVTGGKLPQEEIDAYIARAHEKYPHGIVGSLDIHVVNSEYVDITYHLNRMPFQRIRRITGYLVGTMDRWNNAKAAEERDRVKHV